MTHFHINRSSLLEIKPVGSRLTSIPTGRKLTIADLFTNDADIGELLNTKVADLIHRTSIEYMDVDKLIFGYNQRLELVSPFRGIQGDQVFALGEAGIQLVFDDRTLEFNTFAKAFQYDIAYSAILPFFVADRRFVSDKEIYLNPIEDHRFLYDTDYTAFSTNDRQVTVDGHPWYFYSRYPKDFDVFYTRRISAMHDESRDWVIARHFDSTIDYMNSYIYAHRLGKYVLLDASVSVSLPNWGANIQKHECYEGKKIVPLNLLFTKGYDVEALIKPKILKQLSYFEGSLNLTQQYTQYRSNLVFTLSETALILDMYAISPTDGKPYPIEVYLTYEEIGGVYLTIFD